jgi:hypothetical protein
MGKEADMLLLAAIVLAVLWLIGFGVYHVASFAIHLLLVLAVAALIVHFVRGMGRRTIGPTEGRTI